MSHFDLPAMFKGLARCVSTFDEVLRDNLDLTGYNIDEVAYLFPDYHRFDAFTKEAVRQDGCIMFNTAEDHVHTLPLRTCYDVDYRFFTVPVDYLDNAFIGSGVRVEAMMVRNGLSPLHVSELAKMYFDDAKTLAIHASFKCVNEEQYAAVCHRLRTQGWESPQRCESDYGRFSYWTPIERSGKYEDLPFVYLKPRVNTRDAA